MTQDHTAIIIGRWQIFHKGHETLLNAALAAGTRVVVVIGSAFHSRNPPNPFTWQERRDMIEATLLPAQRVRVQYLPIRDYYDDQRWTTAVKAGVAALNAHDTQVTLVGFKKDNSSYYLDNFPQWHWQGVEREIEIDATTLRYAYFATDGGGSWRTELEHFVGEPVLDYLQQWRNTATFAQRCSELAAVRAYRARWTAAEYFTADAVVQASGHVLLVRRGGDIGHGLWALPGGFVEPGERMYAAALRELQEETGFKTLASTMQAAFQGSVVFDHPGRSPRGRIITHAHHFNLGNIALPEVKGADDAMEARWIPIAELPAMEDQLFDDHAAVLDRFVGVFR